MLRCGVDSQFLRKENLRLTKEVKRLMTAEKRFDTESLLDNRALTRCAAAELRLCWN